jgi:hypothetical protein
MTAVPLINDREPCQGQQCDPEYVCYRIKASLNERLDLIGALIQTDKIFGNNSLRGA